MGVPWESIGVPLLLLVLLLMLLVLLVLLLLLLPLLLVLVQEAEDESQDAQDDVTQDARPPSWNQAGTKLELSWHHGCVEQQQH